MSASNFVMTLRRVVDDLRTQSRRFQTVHARAAAALTALRDWSGPVGGELLTALEAQYRYLSQLPAWLATDIQRVERIGRQLAEESLLPAYPCQRRMLVKSFVAALDDEFQQAGPAAAEPSPIGNQPPFQAQRAPTDTAPLAQQISSAGHDLVCWAEETDLDVASHLGVCFDDLYSESFLPSVALAHKAGRFGDTLMALGGALDVVSRAYAGCALVTAQFQPQLKRSEPWEVLGFDVLILSPELALYREPEFGSQALARLSQRPLPIQIEAEGI